MRKTHLEGTSWASIRGRETTRAHPPWSRPEAVMSEQGERSRGHPLIRLPIVGSPIGQGSRGVCCPMCSVLPGSGEKAFEGPEQLMVGSGEFQFINCTAGCTDPKRLVLETALNKTLLESQTQWKLFKVYNISRDEELLCSSTCGGKQETKVFHIAVFCECRPRGPAARDRSLCLQTRPELLCHCSWMLPCGPHLPGLLDPGHRLRICSHPYLAPLNPASNQDFQICSERNNPSNL